MNRIRPLMLIFLIVYFVIGMLIQAFGQPEHEAPAVVLGGFVRADAAWDSRLNVESREGFFVFWPKPVYPGSDGKDLNARPGFNMWAMTTRLNVRSRETTIGGAQAHAFMEGDFTGPSNIENNAFRLRHAYISIRWTHVSVLAGQYWTPLDVPEALPRPLALNTGAPFHSFARNPQLRLEWNEGKLKLVGALITQRDYASSGPAGTSADYLRFSPWPNLHFQLQFNDGKNYLLGAGIDWKRLAPRLITDSLTRSDENVESVSLTAFGKMSYGNFLFKFQSVLGQNLSDHTMAGGYAVETIQPGEPTRYINLNHFFTWVDVSYRLKDYEAGFFGGWIRNLGTRRPATSRFYGRGENIAYAWRAAPRLGYYTGPLSLWLEVEYTTAAYGLPDNRYKIASPQAVGNLRVQGVASYVF